MKRVLLPALVVLTLALACGGAAWADTIDDPLHGVCNGSGGGACVDNGTNTPLGNSTSFSFTISPGPQTGDLLIDILVPDNYIVPGSFTLTTGGGATNVGTANEVSTTAWTSGTLAGYLGISASPNNPIGAFLPTTDALDPGADGFFVFQVDLGMTCIPANDGTGCSGSNTIPTFDTISGLGSDFGAYIVGFCGTGCTSPYVATANSGALLVNGNMPVPEPGSLMMLGAGLLGLALLSGRRVLAV